MSIACFDNVFVLAREPSFFRFTRSTQLTDPALPVIACQIR